MTTTPRTTTTRFHPGRADEFNLTISTSQDTTIEPDETITVTLEPPNPSDDPYLGTA